MKFTELYESVIGLWPDKIRIDDNGVSSHGAEGHYFPALSKAWHQVEEAISKENEWQGLMVWTQFACFHKLAMKRVVESCASICKTGSGPSQTASLALMSRL
ncbi:MAG: hypothetical protein KC422_11045 [Trueperaceae bacterium]|nr:hypothetical protein [Trueperaceae bacterium]